MLMPTPRPSLGDARRPDALGELSEALRCSLCRSSARAPCPAPGVVAEVIRVGFLRERGTGARRGDGDQRGGRMTIWIHRMSFGAVAVCSCRAPDVPRDLPRLPGATLPCCARSLTIRLIGQHSCSRPRRTSRATLGLRAHVARRNAHRRRPWIAAMPGALPRARSGVQSAARPVSAVAADPSGIPTADRTAPPARVQPRIAARHGIPPGT